MILYFTGTGNSRYLAYALSQEIHDEVISINEYLKKEKKAVFYSERPYVFVLPTHAWQIPKAIAKWIEDASFSGHNSVYVILSCGSNTGKADYFAKRLFHKKTQLCFQGLQYIVMPENYIILFKATETKEAKQIIRDSYYKVKELSQYILKEEKFPKINYYFGSILQSTLIHDIFYKMIVKDKDFYANDQCISCQKCVQLCPFHNIQLVNGKPQWQGNCHHCMACLCLCPVEAIDYGRLTKNKKRYSLLNEYESNNKGEKI